MCINRKARGRLLKTRSKLDFHMKKKAEIAWGRWGKMGKMNAKKKNYSSTNQ